METENLVPKHILARPSEDGANARKFPSSRKGDAADDNAAKYPTPHDFVIIEESIVCCGGSPGHKGLLMIFLVFSQNSSVE